MVSLKPALRATILKQAYAKVFETLFLLSLILVECRFKFLETFTIKFFFTHKIISLILEG